MREIDPLISNFGHLKDKAREAEALKTLQKIASLVKPIMRQRGWRVGTLREFYPPERNLLGLNWNRGQEICLRLRYPGDERQFLPMDQVVDTMLHELSHIVHDEHDNKFHALWQQLRDEHEQLVGKGYTGEGFLSKGHQLGGRRIPMDEARRRARAVAEKRRQLNASSGQRLGGMPVQRGADMRQVIADAVQRRLTVTKGCASGSKDTDTKAIIEQATRNGFRTQAEEDDANERAIMEAYIELLQEEEKEKWGDAYLPPSAQNPSGSASKGDSSNDPIELDDSQAAPASSAKRAASNRPESSTATSRPPNTSWACSICTLENPLNYLCCDACGTERSEDVSARIAVKDPKTSKPTLGRQDRIPSGASKAPTHWTCHRCDTIMESQWWTCSNCGAMKLSS
ncbi:MAG: hypothetical protein M1816_006100 [Peltula sp. TS41687]|nr:MAG: hypothetical protein M1816_006100 [Peltula sp. TS41687]